MYSRARTRSPDGAAPVDVMERRPPGLRPKLPRSAVVPVADEDGSRSWSCSKLSTDPLMGAEFADLLEKELADRGRYLEVGSGSAAPAVG